MFLQHGTFKMSPKICLNMIVKNESRIITRLLDSVVNFIDSYCICDTGSTDNTPEIIQEYFSNINIPGRIISEPFKNFEYNRTFALTACLNLEDADYLLLLDADMVLEIDASLNIQEFKRGLTSDIYYIYQGSPTYYYKNVRLIKNRDGIKYLGVTHEYIKPLENSTIQTIETKAIFIKDIGDGGSKQDKFMRDINLLKQGLVENPDNERYVFYLGNSYKDSGDYDNAIETYKHRIKMGGWIEEVWHSYYFIGKCSYLKQDFPNAISFWMDGYNFYPERIENLYEIVRHYRIKREFSTAYSIYCLADYAKRKKTTMDHLFLQYDIYDYKLDYELVLIAYYVNYMNHNVSRICMNVLSSNIIDFPTQQNVLSNYKFYSIKLSQKGEPMKQIQDLLCENTIKKNLKIDREYNTSTPTICITDKNHLVIIVRYVNYKIDDMGVHYDNKPQICSINVLLEFDENNRKIREHVLHYDKKQDGIYVGIEDIRLLYSKNQGILYSANRGITIGNIMVEYGTLNLSNNAVFSKLITKENRQLIEKNWVLFENLDSENLNETNKKTNEIMVVYKWFPLTIGKIRDNDKLIEYDDEDEFLTLDICSEIDTPGFFRFVRGSSNGIRIQNEIWFLTHIVSHEDKRFYYHMIVTIHPKTHNILRYTPLFTFEGKSIEYALGFVYEKESDSLLIGYSVMDRTTQFLKVRREHIENLFII